MHFFFFSSGIQFPHLNFLKPKIHTSMHVISFVVLTRINKVMICPTSCNSDWAGTRPRVPLLFTANIYGSHYPNADAGGWLPKLEVKYAI